MKNKTKLLAVVVFALLFTGLLRAVAPLLFEGLYLPSLELTKVRAAERCCALWYGGSCYEWVQCSEEPPSDEVDRGGRPGAFDPQSPDIRVDFPPGAVSAPVVVRAYRTEPPAGVPAPANGSIGAPFYFGAWIRGQDQTVRQFDQPVVINVEYPESALAHLAFPQSGSPPSLPLALVTYPAMALLSPGQSASGASGNFTPSDEGKLRLGMYDPATQAWIKLCSRVDPYTNIVSAALILPTPIEKGGNALLAVISDDTPALEQEVDARGTTTLSIPDSNFRLEVLAGTVEVGTYFEITQAPNAPAGNLFRLLPTPVDVKACQADYDTPNQITQITQFPKPMMIEFDLDAQTLSRAGGRANLTIVSLRDRQWADLEEFGFKLARSNTAIGVDTSDLGTFSLAVR